MYVILILCFVSLITLSLRINAELFTSTADLEYLVDTQRIILDELDNLKEDNQDPIIKRYTAELRRENEIAMKNIPNYVQNPINVFRLIKRLTIDLKHVNSTEIGAECLKIIQVKYTKIMIPTLEDLSGAAQGMVRLKDMYKLKVKDLAEGNLNGVYCTPMSVSDCFELGLALHNARNFVNAHEWIVEGFVKNKEEQIVYPFSDLQIIEYINLAEPNKTKRIELEYEMDIFYRNHINIQELDLHSIISVIKYIRNAFPYKTTAKKYLMSMTMLIGRVLFQAEQRTNKEYDWKWGTHEELCRGELELPKAVSSSLTCRYMTEQHPFLKIAPFKIEMLYHDPDVILFHDILSDGEIESFIETSRPKMTRSSVVNENEIQQTDDRLSKSDLIYDNEAAIASRIARRVEQMTGLNLEADPTFSIINYGIGGFYVPHHDVTLKDAKEHQLIRLATVLFYMSDVIQGGATVFPKLGLTISPVKGTAIVWNNLHGSGMANLAMLHSGCPVLYGSKWVATKWIKFAGQEFIKPCGLEFQDEGYSRKYPMPVPKTELISHES